MSRLREVGDIFIHIYFKTFVTGGTHFYSARCIFNKVVSACPHFYYLPTSRAPLCQTMSASSKLHAQTTSRCSEVSATIDFLFTFGIKVHLNFYYKQIHAEFQPVISLFCDRFKDL